MALFRRIIAALSGSAPTVPVAPKLTPATAWNTSKFAEDFSAFQDAVKRAGIKSRDATATVPDIAPMTWWTGDTDTQEFRVAGELVMTASVSISPGPGFVALVGESHYQDALQRAKFSRPCEDEPVYMATLVREPQNVYDPNAVAVVIEPFGTVGYIGREVARRFAPIIDAPAPTPVRCPAQLRGGSPGKPFLGVVLDSALATGARLSHYDPNHTPDYDRCEEYHRRQRANEAFIAETKALEDSDCEHAIGRYRTALRTTRDIEGFATEHNLFPGYIGGVQEKNVRVLDRLTMCLIKAGRSAEALDETDRFFADSPLAAKLTLATAVRKRVEKHRVPPARA